MGIGKTHGTGKEKGKKEGRKENRSLSALSGGCGERTGQSSLSNKLLLEVVPPLVLVSAPGATGVCKKDTVPPQTHPSAEEGSEGCMRGEMPPKRLSWARAPREQPCVQCKQYPEDEQRQNIR